MTSEDDRELDAIGTPDIVSQVFDATEEAHAEFRKWSESFRVKMLIKHGNKAGRIESHLSEIFVDGERKFMVVMELKLMGDVDDAGFVPPPREGGGGA